MIGSDWHKLPFDSFTITAPQKRGNRVSVTVRGLAPGETYKHRVKAVGAQGTSGPSIEVQKKALDQSPPKPTKPKWRSLKGGRGVDLFWDAVSGATGYKVLIDPVSKPSATIVITNRSADITALVQNKTYTFKVVATNRFGDSPESDGIRVRTPKLQYWWGHQADHTVKYTTGTISSSIIEDAIEDAAEDWNDEMAVLNKGLKICDDVDISCGSANTDGWIVTIQTASTTRASDSGGCGGSYACVKMSGTGGRSDGPGKHMVNMTMVFEEPGFQCDDDPCTTQSQVIWTDVKKKQGTRPPGMGPTSSNLSIYIFIDYVMLHEFGHPLGLSDFYDDTTGLKNVTAIMNKHWVAQEIKDEDIEQLKAIYILHTKH